MQIQDWFLGNIVHKPLLAMLLEGLLPCTKKLQVLIFLLILIQEIEFFIIIVFFGDIFLLYLADTVRKEAATIMAVFPTPNEVMSILVQVQTVKIVRVYSSYCSIG